MVFTWARAAAQPCLSVPMDTLGVHPATPGAQVKETADTEEDHIETGLSGLDKLALIRPGTTTLVFGLPGVGASTLALQTLVNGSRTANASSLIISWESNHREITARMMASIGRVDVHGVLTGQMRDWDLHKVSEAADILLSLPITQRTPPTEIAGLRNAIEGWRDDALPQPGVVLFDGVAVLARTASLELSTSQAHSRLSAEVKALAMKLNIAIIFTLPATRDFLNQAAGPPRLADVAYSSDYATDADNVIAIHREDLHDLSSPRAGEADLLVLKSRHSPKEGTTVAFQGHYSRFVDLIFINRMSGPPSQPTQSSG